MKRPTWIIPVKRLVLSSSTGDWCRLPYPGHPRGCPNYGRQGCPPTLPRIDEVIDTSKRMYLVHSEFNLEEHQLKMKELHPEWTERQCRCVLYWQPKSRSQLKERTEYAKILLGMDWSYHIPEAMGLNVYTTAKLSGLTLEKIKGLKICRHVSLIGRKLK